MKTLRRLLGLEFLSSVQKFVKSYFGPGAHLDHGGETIVIPCKEEICAAEHWVYESVAVLSPQDPIGNLERLTKALQGSYGWADDLRKAPRMKWVKWFRWLILCDVRRFIQYFFGPDAHFRGKALVIPYRESAICPIDGERYNFTSEAVLLPGDHVGNLQQLAQALKTTYGWAETTRNGPFLAYDPEMDTKGGAE